MTFSFVIFSLILIEVLAKKTQIVFELKENINPQTFGFENDLIFEKNLQHLPGNFFLFSLPNEEESPLSASYPSLDNHPHVLWHQIQTPKSREKKNFGLPQDPKYESQWYLHQTINSIAGVHSHVERVWTEFNITGNNITISVVDDGLDYHHPDLILNYNKNSSWDWNDDDSEPLPSGPSDDHGTKVGGCAAASTNNYCGVGSAPQAQISCQRLLGAPATDLQESLALSFQTQTNFIFSNSWGPADDARRLEGPGRLTRLAMEESVRKGRGGLGSIYVWAGGNGRQHNDNCNYDGFANWRYTITVGSISNPLGEVSYYSEPCSMLIGVTGSSGGSIGLSTTERNGLCTENFGGTSGSAPVAAGIVSLILEMNDKLTWRDVQDILIRSSLKVVEDDEGWFKNGAGLWFNHNYGFGLLNAYEAVSLAKNWVNLPPVGYLTYIIPVNQAVTDTTKVISHCRIPSNFIIEHVDVVLEANHSKRGDLEISLVSPSNSKSILSQAHSDPQRNIFWRYSSIVHWGEYSKGFWTLIIRDGVNNGNVGVVDRWELTIYGHCLQNDSNCIK